MKAKLRKDLNGMYFLEGYIEDIPKSINVYQQISDKKARWGFGEHSGKLSFENCKLIEDDYDLKESTQQTEWDVEVVTEFIEEEKTVVKELSWGRLVPRLDADGCLILKRIEL